MRRLCLPEEHHRLRTLLAGALHRSTPMRYLHRLHAVLLVSIGRSCYEVARWFGDDPRSIERWVHAFAQSGEDGLRDHHIGGRRSRLQLQQLDALARDLAQAPAALGYHHARWSGKLIAHHVQARFGVRLSARQCLRLRRPDLRRDKPNGDSVPGRARCATPIDSRCQ